MPASTALVSLVASFYSNKRTPPYSDPTVVMRAPLALSASNPHNRFACELSARFMSPTICIDVEQPRKPEDMYFYESREANTAVAEYTQKSGCLGVRTVQVQPGDPSSPLKMCAWWLKRRMSPRQTIDTPIMLTCQPQGVSTLDLGAIAKDVHLLSLCIQHADDLETLLLPAPTEACGPLETLRLTNCRVLARVVQSQRTPAGSNGPAPELLSTLNVLELFSCSSFSFDPFLPFCTNLKVIRGFTPEDHETNYLGALSHLAKLHTFEVSCSELRSLKGLERCRELEVLDVRECFELENISALAGLPKLCNVAIAMSGVTSLDPLLSCPMLQVLNVSSCEQLNGLPTFPKGSRLRDIDISYTSLSDLSPLANCLELDTIHINNCSQLTDLGAVMDLPKMKTVDFEEGVALETVPAILFPKTMYLYEWHGARRFGGDYSGLESMTVMDCGSLRDLSGLEHAHALTSVQLTRNAGLMDVSALAGKVKLASVEIEGCPVQSLEWLRTCPAVRRLRLYEGPVFTDLQPLFESPCAKLLESLYLGNDGTLAAEEVSRLGELTALTELFLTDVPLNSLSVLAGCTKLRTLDVSRCETIGGSLAVLAYLPHLEKLSASDTSITSVLPDLGTVPADVTLFPALKDLSVVRCAKLTVLCESSCSGGATHAISAGLSVMPLLEEFIGSFSALTDIGVLGRCHTLVRVDVDVCPSLTDLTPFFATAMTRTTDTSCAFPRLTRLFVEQSGLTTLYSAFGDSVKDSRALLVWLEANCPVLNSLSVSRCALDEHTLAAVRAFASARHLEELESAPGYFMERVQRPPMKLFRF